MRGEDLAALSEDLQVPNRLCGLGCVIWSWNMSKWAVKMKNNIYHHIIYKCRGIYIYITNGNNIYIIIYIKVKHDHLISMIWLTICIYILWCVKICGASGSTRGHTSHPSLFVFATEMTIQGDRRCTSTRGDTWRLYVDYTICRLY